VLLLIRVAEPAVSIRIESVMATFRAMIARWRRDGNAELARVRPLLETGARGARNESAAKPAPIAV
jgi:hypothetical protein